MNRLLSTASIFSLFIFSFANSASTFAQAPPPSHPATLHAGLKENLHTFVATPGISGYENELAEKIRAEISAFHPKTDNLGDIVVTIGSGAIYPALGQAFYYMIAAARPRSSGDRATAF